MARLRAFGVRVPVVLASMSLVLVLLFAGQFIHQRQTVDQPLVRSLSQTPAVRSVTVSAGAAGVIINVKLGQVANLREAYMALENRAAAVLGDTHFSLLIADSRTPALVDDYYGLNAILMEGLATGHFVQMQQRVQSAGKAMGLDRAAVLLDQSDLYVTLARGGHYLYELIPRSAPTTATAAGGAL